MQIRKTPSWELPDSAVTPEADYLRRREFSSRVWAWAGRYGSLAISASRGNSWFP
jgi:hypothetical protein